MTDYALLGHSRTVSGTENVLLKMASLKTILQLDPYKCKLCPNLLQKPCTLACRHTFCENCLQQYKHDKRGQTENIISCPWCQKSTRLPEGGVSGLAETFRAVTFPEISDDNIDARERREPKLLVVCEVCSRRTIRANGKNASFVYCAQCAQTMCAMCRETHDKMGSTRNHPVIRVSSVSAGAIGRTGASPEEGQRSCSKHLGKTLDKFCVSCCIPICQTCSRSIHLHHKLISADEYVATTQDEIRSKLDQLSQKSEEAELFLSSIKNVKSQMDIREKLFCKKIDIFINQYSRKWKQDVTTKRQKFLQIQKESLHKLHQEAEMAKKNMDAVEANARDVLNRVDENVDLWSYVKLRVNLDEAVSSVLDQSRLQAINRYFTELQLHEADEEPSIGTLVYPSRERKYFLIENCGWESPYAITFTRDGRIATAGTFVEKDTNKTTNYYTAIRQTGTHYKMSTDFSIEIKLSNLYGECILSLAALSDLRFLLQTRTTVHSLFEPNHIWAGKLYIWNDKRADISYFLPKNNLISYAVTDLEDNIYLSDERNEAIYVMRPNGDSQFTISIPTFQLKMVAVCPRKPEEFIFTSMRNTSLIYVVDRSGKRLRTISRPEWVDVAIACDNRKLLYILWKNKRDLRTLQRYTLEEKLIDTLFEGESHSCRELILAVSPGGDVAVVTSQGENAEITVIFTTREYTGE